MNDKYEVVKFEQDNLILDVNVSPNEDTVWLSKEDMSTLFDRDRSVITKHINSIYKEGELDRESTCAKNAHVHLGASLNYICKKVFAITKLKDDKYCLLLKINLKTNNFFSP